MTSGSSETISAPEHLHAGHDVTAFDSGVADLDHWLKHRALSNEENGGSRTYVVCIAGRVIGYYALANGAIAQGTATGRVRRNMPDPVPVMVLGRLAVDQAWQGQDIGRGLLRDAVLRTLQASEIAGIRAILVHAISEDARRFYERQGFTASSLEPMTLMATVADMMRALSG